jgi:flagellin-like protein
MKGISPIVAVVLLIAFVVAVGAIISVFFTGLITGIVRPITPQAEKAIRCGASVLSLDRVSGSWQDVDVQISYITGTENLENLTITYIDTDGDLANVSGPILLVPGEVRLVSNENMTALGLGTTGTLAEVRVTGYCMKTYPVLAICKSGEACWEIG